VENFDWEDHNDMINRACHCIIIQSIDAIKQHISFARIIIIDKDGETFSYRICNIPYAFLSGTYATNGIDLAHNALSSMIKFIDSYNFYSTSDQAYSHSERSVCLALSEEFGDCKISDIISSNTVDLCIQIRNLSRMCVNCEHFIFGRDIYFTKVGGKGCFVTYDYKDDYERCYLASQKVDFIKKYSKALKLNFLDEKIDSCGEAEINDIFSQIIPKDISVLIPYTNALFLEAMNTDRVSEVVKIYLP
jgi:hypothetical protein